LKKGRVAFFNGLNLFGTHTEFFAHVIHGQALLDPSLMQQPACLNQHVGIGGERRGHVAKRMDRMTCTEMWHWRPVSPIPKWGISHEYPQIVSPGEYLKTISQGSAVR
jgi:hypothetical protein